MSRHVTHLSYLASPAMGLHNMNSSLVDAPLSNLVSLVRSIMQALFSQERVFQLGMHAGSSGSSLSRSSCWSWAVIKDAYLQMIAGLPEEINYMEQREKERGLRKMEFPQGSNFQKRTVISWNVPQMRLGSRIFDETIPPTLSQFWSFEIRCAMFSN